MTARAASGSDVTVLVDRIKADVLSDANDFVTPRGYAHISPALVDAVFSIRAHYTGVVRVVAAFSEATGTPADQGVDAQGAPGFHPRGLGDLIDAANGLTGAELADHLFAGNRCKTAGRLKADVCLDVAGRLVGAGVQTARDLHQRAAEAATRKAWTDVQGLGWITWQYFCLCCGVDGMKPDVMLTRFVSRSLGRNVDAHETNHLLGEAFEMLRGSHEQLTKRALDHTIWRFQSGRR